MNGFAQALGGQQHKEQPGPPQDAKAPQVPGTEPKQATPEQQRVYNRFVGLSMAMLWSEKFMAKAAKIIKAHPNETDAMAMIGATIVQRVFMAADDQGEPVPPEVLLHGGLEVMNEVATFAQAAGVQGIEPDEIETAYYLAADKVREGLIQAGKLDPQELAGQFEQIKGMAGEEKLANVQGRLQGAQQKTQDALLSRGKGQQQQQGAAV
ncbi:hypothetical protein [Leisingera sp. M523]|uniref:hypothetical protein n=1 Tax=Leisingera sp. M523 TaxID=2867013 RepID=UPI0021A5B45C|nr:hypothetical protein [Leisingera sp. M523]UWQ30269.1 hypothetical protein K3557_06950 [Leisingera sp. M523]